MEFLELLHLILENIVDGAILLFEFIGVGIIIFSGLRGFWSYLHRSPETKLTLARGLAMGLEFKRDPANRSSPGLERNRNGGGNYCAQGCADVFDSLGD